ncbi:PIN domain-containing protein [Enterovirga sp.]|uniref:PIN domain-containing protein n=1 Tax=Enterovirga sp. TaxID=2026350 RepID=UPI002C4302F8|nr:PIN domain-containing protein [Enterovirga sp.]HMO27735.1 PIN domain-containing protein [Enterovirga sp.]
MLALDTNVLVYAEGVGDPARIAAARDLLEAISRKDVVIPVQALAELAHVLARKTPLALPDIRMRAEGWAGLGRLAPTLESTFSSALSLAAGRQLQIFDAIVLVASAEAGCRLLLSEDMQDGFVWAGVTVANPFAAKRHPMLLDLLAT